MMQCVRCKVKSFYVDGTTGLCDNCEAFDRSRDHLVKMIDGSPEFRAYVKRLAAEAEVKAEIN